MWTPRWRPRAAPGPRRSLRAPCTLAIDQDALALESPSVTAEAAIAAKHAVTGHQYRDAIRRAGRRRGAHGRWRTDVGGELAIADDVALGHLQQEPPHADLKGRAAQVERQVGAWTRAGDVRFELLNPGVEFGRAGHARSHERGARKLAFKLRRQGNLVLAELREAHTAIRGRHEQRSQPSVAVCVSNSLAGAACAVG